MSSQMEPSHYNRIKELESILYSGESDKTTFETAETLANVIFFKALKEETRKQALKVTTQLERANLTQISFMELMDHFSANYGNWENAEKPFERATVAENFLEAYHGLFYKRRLKRQFWRGFVIALIVGLVTGWVIKPR